MPVHAQRYWEQRLEEDRRLLEERRQNGLKQAQAAAKALRRQWPTVRAVHCFGSVLGDGFRDHSDLDLLVDGLPPEALLDAVSLAEQAGDLPVDLKRGEDLSDDLRARLLRTSQPL
ncbi:hypothetical protein EVJ50_09135 [Synechococcus sp. RSCCF101]|uniref:nucleotidyltransferase family protein n=1 Tax=Synechococcus sp. RSCCF101 TaxID=2511069 RepID=UPI0012456DFD|nr:nucleotidyltransferase domain-containing protein [Synechococcus sp. RSCCF101]QEY32360.1 hypothetical protein EVJ50_09135 [Synechococcus sp. RSCCF101]